MFRAARGFSAPAARPACASRGEAGERTHVNRGGRGRPAPRLLTSQGRALWAVSRSNPIADRGPGNELPVNAYSLLRAARRCVTRGLASVSCAAPAFSVACAAAADGGAPNPL